MLSDEEREALQYFNTETKTEAMHYGAVLVKLIEKQSKEIEELKEERKKYPIAMNDEQYKKVIELAQKDIKEELDRQINVRMINEEYIERNYISKDKLKAKIEELENEKEKYFEKQVIQHEIEILQSLLEKE